MGNPQEHIQFHSQPCAANPPQKELGIINHKRKEAKEINLVLRCKKGCTKLTCFQSFQYLLYLHFNLTTRLSGSKNNFQRCFFQFVAACSHTHTLIFCFVFSQRNTETLCLFEYF